jgi:hypothetical protein
MSSPAAPAVPESARDRRTMSVAIIDGKLFFMMTPFFEKSFLRKNLPGKK